tara:strand:- start:898 stop:2001 length:1104 start_codon:yes stop_codon:yes gene_type:complete
MKAEIEVVKYSIYKNNHVKGRYLTNELLLTLDFSSKLNIIGKSVNKLPIYYLKLGTGPVKILIWSQMHGNETTSTRALIDLITFLDTYGVDYLKKISLHIIPVLNPDGAFDYTRNNFNGIDLNRDAILLSQPESIVLNNLFRSVKPHFCFNLHDQRSIYSVSNSKKSSVLSFLSPSADEMKNETNSRIKSMKIISLVYTKLNQLIKGHISRYKDDFNPNCVGDTFQALGTPTILFESGQYGIDYTRENTRKYMCISLITAIKSIINKNYESNDHLGYYSIPQNDELFFDILIRNIKISKENNSKRVDIGIFYNEKLEKKSKKILFNPMISKIGNLNLMNGHKELDFSNNHTIHEITNKNLVDFIKNA